MDQINCTVIGILLLLGAAVFSASKKDEISNKRRGAIACGAAPAANRHNSWPGDENSGNGCTHQTVCAALLGRVKRDKMPGC